MVSNISTGRIVSGAATSGGGTSRTDDRRSRVLFDSSSTSVRSPLIEVEPGRAVRVSAYNLVEPSGVEGAAADYFTVVKVVTASASMPHVGAFEGCGSGNTLLSNPTMPDLYDAPVIINGVIWRVDYNNNVRIISMPGAYRLVASSVDMLNTDIYVDSHNFEADALVVTPLHFGWVK